MKVVVTGANRGLGLGFVRRLLENGDTVFAGVRNPKNIPVIRQLEGTGSGELFVHQLDLTDDESVKAFADWLPSESLDMLINNAAIIDKGHEFPDIDIDLLRRVVEVNAYGQLRLTLKLIDRLRRGNSPKIVSISSILGSLKLVEVMGTSWFGYRVGKAALNMIMRLLAFDLRPYGIAVFLVHPGVMRTRMTDFGGVLDPYDSAGMILETVSHKTISDTGTFFDYAGKPIPW